MAGTAALWLALLLTTGADAAPAVQSTPPAASAQTTATVPAGVPYVLTCTCSADLFSCASFPFWSAAQACFNQCRVEAGFDIHGLDADGDGVACELDIDGPSPFTLPMLGFPALTPTATLTAAVPVTGAPALVPAPVITASAPATMPIAALPAYDAGDASRPSTSEESDHLGSLPYTVLPWAVALFAVVVVGGAFVWLRRRGPASPPREGPRR